MSNKTFTLPENLYQYLFSVSVKEPEILRQLREETAALDGATMQISPEQGQFMSLLVHVTGASRTLEIGVYTGYSSLVVALALPPQGRLVACDKNAEWTSIARRYWKDAGVAEKIDLRLAPAIDTLDDLLRDGQKESFDFIFIDADKQQYLAYYERSLLLVRPGGLIAVDNVLWSGKVADPRETENDTVAIRTFNQRLREDDRVSISLLPIGDGLTLAMKHR